MRILCLAVALIALSFSAYANVDFTAVVSPNPVVVGQNFQVSFRISNGSARSVDPPSFDDFAFVNGPQVSQSTQILNGRMSSTQEFIYVLRAKREGAFSIGPASTTIDGKKYRTKPVTVKVIAKSQQQLAREQALQKQLADNVFIEAHASPRSVYQGEQLLLSYRFFSALNFSDQDFSQPSLNNLWLEKLDTESRGVQVQKDGKRMVRFDLLRAIAFPQKSGEIRLEPYTANITVKVPDNSRTRRDMFGFRRQEYSNEPLSLRSPSLVLNVKPLPEQGKPANFAGIVGEYTVTMSVDKQQAKANDAVTVRIVFEGKGNLKLIDAPELDVPRDIEVYDPKVNDNIDVTSSGMKGRRVFEYVLIPRRAGEFEVQATDVAWFDPKKEQYQQLAKPSVALTIGEGDGDASGIVASGSRSEEVEIVGKDIRFVKEIDAGSLTKADQDSFFGSVLFYVAALAPFPLVLVLVGWRKQSSKSPSTAQRQAQAAKQFGASAKRLQSASSPTYKDIEGLLRTYVSDRFLLPIGEQNKDSIASTLSTHGVNEGTVTHLLATLDQCAMSMYAPSTEQSSPVAMLDQARSVVEQLESEVSA